MSTTASTPSSTARHSPSAITSRPSASVLSTSTVVPLRMVSTSPSFIAEPDGMLSVQQRYAVTAAVQPERLQRGHRAEDRRRAGHVVLHLGVRLVARLEADAAGVVHDPLADQAEVAGGRVGPVGHLDQPGLVDAAEVDAEDAAAAHLDQLLLVVRPSTSRPAAGPSSSATSAIRTAVSVVAGQLARSRLIAAARAMARPRPTPARTSSATSSGAMIVSAVRVGSSPPFPTK